MSLSKGYQSPSHASTQPMMSMTAVCGSSLSPVWNAIAVIARPSKVTGRPIRSARTPLRWVDRPGKVEPDHVGLVAAALTYPRLPDVRHEAESRFSKARPGTPSPYPDRAGF